MRAVTSCVRSLWLGLSFTLNACGVLLYSDPKSEAGAASDPSPSVSPSPSPSPSERVVSHDVPWVTDGTVYASVVDTANDVTYVGGSFKRIGPYSGGGLLFDADSQASGLSTLRRGIGLASSPKVHGIVYAAIPDANGGFYIGGNFSKVGSTARNNVARIRSDGTLDKDFELDANGIVTSLLLSGSTLYVGGSFTTISGQSRNRVAAFDTSTGSLTAFDADADGAVQAMALSGNTLYLGGLFGSLGGQARSLIGAVDATTGLVTSFAPSVSVSSGTPYVTSLLISGTTLYVAGLFDTIGGQSRNHLAALNLGTGLVTSFDPSPSFAVFNLLLEGNTLYVAGLFTSIGGQNRRGLAAVNAADGSVGSFDANVTYSAGVSVSVSGLALRGTTLFIGGTFDGVGGQTRNNLAAVDASDGSLKNFDPSVNASVSVLRLSGDTLYAGGDFSSIAFKSARGVAAFNNSDSSVRDFDGGIAASGFFSTAAVHSMVLSGTTLYVGGTFSTAGGQSRGNLAALNTADGTATSFNPNAAHSGGFGVSAEVRSLVLSGTTLYVGGKFTSIGGQNRNCVAALSTVDGTASAFNPNASGGGTMFAPYTTVYALALSGTTLYAGGDFTTIGGQSRNRLAALDTATSNATSFNPNSSASVRSLWLEGNTLYAGGGFNSIGGQTRDYFAALDTADGTATSLDLGLDNVVNAIHVSGTTVYLGGGFAAIDGQARAGLAAFDSSTGALSSLDISVGGIVFTLAKSVEKVRIGGAFQSIDGAALRNVASIDTSNDTVDGMDGVVSE